MVKIIELTIPDEFAGTPFEKEYLATAQQVITEQTVLRLYQERKISTGRGARMLGLSNHDFLQFLGTHQVSIFRYEEGELEADFKAALSASVGTMPSEKLL
jgi:predicted HTH domain antitoxin